jgi:aldose 1-epimerase
MLYICMVRNGREFRGAILEDTDAGRRIVYEVENGFKHWMVYNGNGSQGFICPEPQTWMVNAPNLDLPDEVTGFGQLQPGQCRQETCRIYVE